MSDPLEPPRRPFAVPAESGWTHREVLSFAYDAALMLPGDMDFKVTVGAWLVGIIDEERMGAA